MNSNSFNVARFNEVVTDSVQRVSTTFTAAAVFSPCGRVRRRAPLEFTPTADIASMWKVMVKAQRTVVAPAARISILGSNRSRTLLNFTQTAVFQPNGTIYPRRNISQGRVRIAPQASGVMAFRTLRPGGRMTITPTGGFKPVARSYEKFRTRVGFLMRARVAVSGETIKQIPYDEDAPDIRVMYVPHQNREMKVG